MGACDAGKIEELNQAIKAALDVHQEINLGALNATSRVRVGGKLVLRLNRSVLRTQLSQVRQRNLA